MNIQYKKTSTIKEYCSKNYIELFLLTFSLIFFFVIIALVGTNFFSRLSVELCEGFKDDGGIYYAVGKGIANGLRPYIDMYETKGPIMFYLCALAYVMSPDYTFMNVLSFMALITIIVAPIFFATFRFISRPKRKRNWLSYLIYLLCCFSFGLLLAAYTQRSAGRIYAEMFALGFLIVYFTFIYLTNSDKSRFYSPTVIVSSIFLMLSIFTKETFGLVALIGSLFICRTKKDFLLKCFLPFLYAGIIAIIFMGCAGILPAYFTIYLKSMLERKIDFDAALSNNIVSLPNLFRVDIIIKDMWNFSSLMTTIIMLTFATSFYWIFSQPYAKLNKKSSFAQISLRTLNILRRCIFSCGIFFVTTVCTSFGNMSWSHLKMVGIPIYILIFYISFDAFLSFKSVKLKKINLNVRTLSSFSASIVLCIGILLLPTFSYENRTYEINTYNGKTQAQYVDAICYSLDEDRYQYLGMIGNRFYAYTKHDPLGPAFIQTNYMFRNENNYLCKQFIIQIHTANVIFFKSYKCGAINDWVKYYVSMNFTSKVPEVCKNIEVPSSWTGKTLFRIGKFK